MDILLRDSATYSLQPQPMQLMLLTLSLDRVWKVELSDLICPLLDKEEAAEVSVVVEEVASAEVVAVDLEAAAEVIEVAEEEEEVAASAGAEAVVSEVLNFITQIKVSFKVTKAEVQKHSD